MYSQVFTQSRCQQPAWETSAATATTAATTATTTTSNRRIYQRRHLERYALAQRPETRHQAPCSKHGDHLCDSASARPVFNSIHFYYDEQPPFAIRHRQSQVELRSRSRKLGAGFYYVAPMWLLLLLLLLFSTSFSASCALFLYVYKVSSSSLCFVYLNCFRDRRLRAQRRSRL